MPMKRLPDPDCPRCGATPMHDQSGDSLDWCECGPDFNSPGWHEDEFGSDLTPYDHSEGDTLGPCGCVDYHMADCDGTKPMTKNDYLDLYAGSYPDDWPDEGE